MGSNCVCMQNKVSYSDFNILCNKNGSLIIMKKNNNEYPTISTSFQNFFTNTSVPNPTSCAIKIQSVYRAYIFRRKTFSLLPKLNRINHHKSRNSIDKTHTPTSAIANPIVKSLLTKYPPLSDGINVILMQVRFPNLAEYSGEWNPNTDERHGRGVQVWSDKTTYFGMWKDDMINGLGKMILNNGECYEGEFVNDKAEGYGTYVNNKGCEYVGSWKDNLMNGNGKMKWKNNNEEYEGEFVNGRMNGKGRFMFKDGSVYVGEFVDDKIQGKGIKTWPNKMVYQGEFKDGKFDGHGKFNWPDGRKYVGHYVDDKKNGYGEFTWVNGKKYRGTWKDGKQDGDGEMYYPKQNVWKKGKWYNGRLVIFEG